MSPMQVTVIIKVLLVLHVEVLKSKLTTWVHQGAVWKILKKEGKALGFTYI